MRDPWRSPFRLRLRTLLIAVALLAVPLALVGRRSRFLWLARHHRARIVGVVRVGMTPGHYGTLPWTSGFRRRLSDREAALDLWHLGLARKYEAAADRPWMPVAPDPPRPDPGVTPGAR